ncbi:MAG TPA: DUF4097 family beta strand repeat-containing protein [Balneolaceae bacterium]|nr:DUF4097 family beta strand repeat-containing protein [Balneolaceae bacterium]
MNTRKNYILKMVLAFSLSLILTFLLIKPSLGSTSGLHSFDDDPYRVETFTLYGAGNLKVETSGGFIRVEGSSGNTVRVEMYVQKDGRELSPEDTDLENWDIEISQSGEVVNVIAERKDSNWSFWGSNNDISVSFVIYTPSEMSTDLDTSGGSIEVSGLKGGQEVSTSGGHIKLANIEGTVEARTSGGHIEVENIQGDVAVRTSGGHITARQITGDLKARTSGGHINLAAISGSIEARTSGGSIEAGLKSVGQFVELKTSGGNIEITLPEDIGLDLNLSASYISADLSNFSGEMERGEVEGALNGGGPEISARTSGGIISLSFR